MPTLAAAVPMDLDLSAMAAEFTRFADRECGSYAPTYDRLARAVAGSTELLAIAANVRPGVQKPNVLLAATHYLFGEELRSMSASAFVARCIGRRDDLTRLCATRLVQTNEARRSTAILPAMAFVASQTPAPLALIEVGASAGLLLRFDRYRIDYGPHGTAGPVDAAVRLTSESRGLPPPVDFDSSRLVSRIGIDLNPVRPGDEDAIRWLQALVWPEHTERRTRLDAALGDLATDPPTLVRGDALDELPRVLAALPEDAMPVVMHYATLAHFTPAARQQFRSMLYELSAASPTGMAHIAAEAPSSRGHSLELDLALPGRPATHLHLASVHAHGEWIDWQPALREE